VFREPTFFLRWYKRFTAKENNLYVCDVAQKNQQQRKLMEKKMPSLMQATDRALRRRICFVELTGVKTVKLAYIRFDRKCSSRTIYNVDVSRFISNNWKRLNIRKQ